MKRLFNRKSDGLLSMATWNLAIVTGMFGTFCYWTIIGKILLAVSATCVVISFQKHDGEEV